MKGSSPLVGERDAKQWKSRAYYLVRRKPAFLHIGVRIGF